jgi:hypothetical protein
LTSEGMPTSTVIATFLVSRPTTPSDGRPN